MPNNWWKRVQKWLFSGWGLSGLLGLAHTVREWLPALWRRATDLDSMRSIWEWMGGDAPTLIWIATSPYFGIVLLVVGLLGLPTIEAKVAGHPMHRVWPWLGWAIFITSASLLGAALLFGSYAFSSGVLEAKRFFVEQHTERHLSDGQRAALCTWVKSAAPEIFTKVLVTSDKNPESYQYATEIYNHMKECGAHFINIDQNYDAVQEAYPVHSGPSICSSGGVVAVRAGQAH